MRIPEFIKPGDTIGLVAPSFGAGMEPYITRFHAAVKKFEERGYRVKCADSCFKSDGLGISTKPADAAADLMNFYLDDSIDALISVGGGELMNETISCVDFEQLKQAKPKWYMGYSDNTNMIFPMATLCDVPGIYGPCACGFGKPWEDTERDAFALLEGTSLTVHGYDKFERPDWDAEIEEPDPLAKYMLTEPKILRSFVPGKNGLQAAEGQITMEGMLLGGCLDILENLSGTRFDGTRRLVEEGKKIIWVIEACDLTPMAIRRTVWHLKQQGWFDTAAGFLVGRPLASFEQDMLGVDAYNAVTDVIADLEVPVIMDADIGHVAPMMPLIIGSHAEVKAEGNDLEVKMSLMESER